MTEQATPATGAALRDPANQVSPKAPVIWTIGAVIFALVVAAGLIAAIRFGWFSVAWWGWALYAVVMVPNIFLRPMISYRVHRWESTETAVYTQTGWLSRERRIAPMSRVQTVDFTQGVIQRMVGLASVTVTTASSQGPLQIEQLDLPVAQRLVEELTRTAAQASDDAT